IKWNSGDFEPKSNDDQNSAEQRGILLKTTPRQYRRDLWQIRFACSPKNPRDSIDQESCCNRAEDQILDCRLQRGRIASGKTDQHIERDRHQLKRNKDQDEIDRRSHPHQSCTGEKWKRKKFAES